MMYKIVEFAEFFRNFMSIFKNFMVMYKYIEDTKLLLINILIY